MLHLLLSSLNLSIDKASQTSNDTRAMAALAQNCILTAMAASNIKLLREALEIKTK
jgi:hypothetical protein